MQHFNDHVYRCAVEGWNLVEANAGTGKTYQVQNLYARCVMEKDWSIDKILVVTFTEAATKELRERLQKVLNDCVIRLDAFADSDAPSVITLPPEEAKKDQVGRIIDATVANLIASGEASDHRSARLRCRIRARAAVLNFDNNAISTIHGFCSRMLGEAAFECGADFDAELVTDKTQLLHEVVRDVWRQLVLPLKGDDAKLAADKLKFDDMVRLAATVLNKPKVTVLPDLQANTATAETLVAPLREVAADAATDAVDAELDQLLAQWHVGEPTVEALKASRQALAVGDAEAYAQWTSASLRNRVVPPKDFLTALKDFSAACQILRDAFYGVSTKLGNWKPELSEREECKKAWETIARLWKEWKTNDLKLFRDTQWVERFFKKDTVTLLSVENLQKLDDAAATGDDAAFEAHFRILAKLSDTHLKSQRRQTVVVPYGSGAQALIDACDAIERAVGNRDHWLLWLKRRIVEASKQRLDAIKRSRNLMTFDDLLVRLSDALADGKSGELLKQAIKSRYEIAQIDEFQDTDFVQYKGVFKTGFADNDVPVFVLGDPRQSIYAFRSGDLATFFEARNAVPGDKIFGLTTNWRSQPGMVHAFNELFEDVPGDVAEDTVNRAFATGEMPYVASAPGKKADEEADPEKPLVIEHHEEEGDNKTTGRQRAARLVAERIAHLVHERKIKPGEKSIAVLVNTHAEARMVKEQLAAQKPPIAAVLQSNGKIFQSDEAEDFRLILQAMLEPRDVSAVRAAVATPILKGGAKDLLLDATEASSSADVQKACGDFQEAHNVWKKHGLVVAFMRLATAQRIRQRQLSLVDGERRWTNLLQVAELLDGKARSEKLGMHAVARWLDRQLSGAEQDDAYEIRLESDASAVEIITVFKSKGLQRDYVFVPFVWAKTPAITNFTKLLEYHEGRKLVLNLDVKGLLLSNPDEDPAVDGHEDEKLQECLRLLYVAVTRAKHEAHLIHLKAGDEPRNALSYLLTNEAPPVEPVIRNWDKKNAVPVPDADKNYYEVISGDDAETRYALSAGPPDSPPPPAPAVPDSDDDDDKDAKRNALPLSRGEFKGRIDRNWQILSFSKLAGHGGGMDAHDWDAESGERRSEAVIAEERQRLRKDPRSIFGFKAGKVTGNCWHAIFEHLDFSEKDPAVIGETVEKWATLYRLIGPADDANDERTVKLDMLVAMVHATLKLDLPLGAGRLEEVAWSNRQAEMQFHFPVGGDGVSRMKIAQVLAADKYGWDKRTDPAIKPVLDKWLQAPKTKESEDSEDEDERDDVGLRGFMTGFIDLTFCVGGTTGKYYLLDWKSNQLDGTYEGFTKEALVGEMAHARYFLQYMLYSAALHQYLKTNLSDYSYEDNFGGAFYVFLRGVCKPPVALWQGEEWNAVERSVYGDRPPEKLLNALWKTLSGGEA